MSTAAQGAILRRIRIHGPQSDSDLRDALPFGRNQVYNARRALLADGTLLVSQLVYRSRGRSTKRYGIVGLHRPAVTLRERIRGALRVSGPATPLDLAGSLGFHHSTIRHHLHALTRSGVVEKVGSRRYRTGGSVAPVYALVEAA